MLNLTLYQTLRNDDNPEYVEQNGPFKCVRGTAWLGHGFYFWDTHVELGHWWGEINYAPNGYMICEANAILAPTCWDLHGNGSHRLEFREVCEELIKNNISTKERLLVAQVIEFLKKKRVFKYEAVRALGVNTISSYLSDNKLIYRMKFVSKSAKTFLDLIPAVQVCLLHKTALSLQNYYVIYPEEYKQVFG